ncbi:MAG: ORF6N domain-containing protein [Bacteroidales bacterium]|nr:ORF6N domain-containing protein [Bacteroidales bacterium]
MSKNSKISIPDEVVMQKIYMIRGMKVMLDQDLAVLYDVETKRLNEQVKRNISRFPDDFMFQLNKEEFIDLKSQFATSSWGGRRKPPLAFSEHGILMLSSVLNYDRAIKVNIQIIRIFIKMRELLMNHKDIILQLEHMQQKVAEHDNNILLIFEYIKELEREKQIKTVQENRNKIGFKR